MDGTDSEGPLISRRTFLKNGLMTGVGFLLSPELIQKFSNVIERIDSYVTMDHIKNRFPAIVPDSDQPPGNLEKKPFTDDDYQHLLSEMILKVPTVHDKSEGRPFDAGMGYASYYGPEKLTGIPTAQYHAYCAVFRARMDGVDPDRLPARLSYIFKKAKLYDLYQKLWEPNAQISQIQQNNSFKKYSTTVCTEAELEKNLLLPDDSPLLSEPDPEKMLATDQVLGLCATSNPLILGQRFLVYSVVRSDNDTFIRQFVGTTLAVDVPWGNDQKRLDNEKYDFGVWHDKPLPWVLDASLRIFKRLPEIKNRPWGGRPGALLVSENIYRKYHSPPTAP
jgi:hypothetical protein